MSRLVQVALRFTFLGLVVALGQGQALRAEEPRLSADEIRSAVAGNTLTGLWQGEQYHQSFAAEGSFIYKPAFKAARSGAWRIDDAHDTLCTRFEAAKREDCFAVFRDGAALIRVDAVTGYRYAATLITGHTASGGGTAEASDGQSTAQRTAPPGAERMQLTYDELMATDHGVAGPVHNGHFMPVGAAGAALHDFAGRLLIPAFSMEGGFAVEERWLPPLEIAFFTHAGHLVPAERDIIRGEFGWNLILSPGRVWSEPGDQGLSRASFPFVVAGRVGNNAHHGLASFLYDETRVSGLRFQIVQESASWMKHDAWGQMAVAYRPGPIEDQDALSRRFAAELEHRLAIHPLSALAGDHDPVALEAFAAANESTDITLAGLVADGAVYALPCRTRFGDYPYCREMRHGVFSVTKTLGALVSLLRLAQTYGDAVFEARIVDYVDLGADHGGWDAVTFADALSMATGIGDVVPERVPYYVRGTDDFFWLWMRAESAAEKLRIVGGQGDYPWGPGAVFRYRDVDTFVLAAAMDGYLKSKAGPDANLWDLVAAEVLRPIGIFHAPAMHSIEPGGRRGVPILSFGYYPTLEDVAKLTGLLRNGGRHEGVQLLSAAKLAEALKPSMAAGLPTGWNTDAGEYRYHLSVWRRPYRSADHDCAVSIPTMVGHGGNFVLLLPNGMTALRFADGMDYRVGALLRAADRLRPICGG